MYVLCLPWIVKRSKVVLMCSIGHYTGMYIVRTHRVVLMYRVLISSRLDS